MTSGSGRARKRVLSEEAITSQTSTAPNCEYLDRRARLSENKHQSIKILPTPNVLCKHNSFAVGSANPSKQYAPLRNNPSLPQP